MDSGLDGGLPLHGLHALQVASQQGGAVLDRRSGEDGRGQEGKEGKERTGEEEKREQGDKFGAREGAGGDEWEL